MIHLAILDMGSVALIIPGRPDVMGRADAVQSGCTTRIGMSGFWWDPPASVVGRSGGRLLQVRFEIVDGPVGLAEDGAEGAGCEAAVEGDDDGPFSPAVLGVTATCGDVLEPAPFQGLGHCGSGETRGDGGTHATRRTSTGAVITSVTSGAGASSK